MPGGPIKLRRQGLKLRKTKESRVCEESTRDEGAARESCSSVEGSTLVSDFD